LNQGLVIPIGSVDIANISWNYFVLEKLDFVGINIYCGTWDNVSEDLMLDATKQTFAETVSLFQSKLVLITETGTPYSGGSYSVDGGTQTASVEKAVHYLSGFLDWIKQEQIPSFYFESYDEPVKSQNGGHPIEQFFGIMNGNLEIHSFYKDLLPASIEIIGETSLFSVYPNPTNGLVTLEFETEGVHIVTLAEMSGRILLRETANGQTAKIDLSDYPAGVYLLTMDDGKRQSTMRIVKR
jgi:hypothetical protein